MICHLHIGGLKILLFLFQKTFDTPDVKEQISKFMKSPYISDNQKLSIGDAIDSFNGIIYTACAKSLKKIKNKNNTRK